MRHGMLLAVLSIAVVPVAAATVHPELFPVTVSTYAVAGPRSQEAPQYQPPLTIHPASTAAPVPPAVAAATAPATSSEALIQPTFASLKAEPLSGGKPLSLDLRDMDVVDVLKMLARQNGINMIIGKNVSGKVTVFLNGVDFWEAFKTILDTRDLAYRQEGDLYEIMTGPEYEREFGVPFSKKTDMAIIPFRYIKAITAKEALEPLRSKAGNIIVDEVTNSLIIDDNPASLAVMKSALTTLDAPMEYRVFRLNYASADDLLPKLSPLVSKDFGNIQIDKRSNTLMVQDNPARMKDIQDIVKAFDVRNKAVLIEAKILQITLNKSSQWGINWQGVNWSSVFNQLNGYHVTGQVVENLLLTPAAAVQPGNVTAQGLTATVGVMEKPNFQAVVNFLSTLGHTNLLSSPRVMALNNQEAKISVGTKVAKITNTLINAGSTTTSPITTESVEFLDVGVKLTVTPTIGDDSTITMKVAPEVSSVDHTITLPDGSSIPIIRVAQAQASLVVKDGVTVVLGGLMEDTKSSDETGVPFLSRIPLLGYLFKSKTSALSKTELVIFLTPRIVDGDTVAPEAQSQLNLDATGAPKPVKKGFWRRLFGAKDPSHV